MPRKLSTVYLIRQISREISSAVRYYDRILQWVPHESDRGELLEQIECPRRETVSTPDQFPDLSGERDQRTAVLLYATFNYHFDIQRILMELKPKLSRTTRVVAVSYNPYVRWVFSLATWIGLRTAETPTTFVTRAALWSIAKLAGFEIVRARPTVYSPFGLLGLGTLLNRVLSLIPFAQNLSLVEVLYLRPIIESRERPSLSIVIPARNEAGNIEAALERLPDFGDAKLEVIFVEGHSRDGTWAEIQRVVTQYAGKYDCKAYQQAGVGKADAVRLGLRHATGQLLTILDADLTMPPEMLPRYYDAWCRGDADLINGSRLVYPMEGKAMRFLNLLGNVFFAKTLSWIMGVRVSDVLCGTKLVARHDYQRFCRWCQDFGDFDPFGDFELLFPAAVMALGIVDVPIRYRNRTYGATQISRFLHGWELLRMTAVALVRLKPSGL